MLPFLWGRFLKIPKLLVYVLLCLEMDTRAGQIPQGWCSASRPGEMGPHINGLQL